MRTLRFSTGFLLSVMPIVVAAQSSTRGLSCETGSCDTVLSIPNNNLNPENFPPFEGPLLPGATAPGHAPHPAQNYSETVAERSCVESTTEEDNKHIAMFLKRSENLKQAYSGEDQPDVLMIKQAELRDEYEKTISPNGLTALAVLLKREELAQMVSALQNDSELKNAYAQLEKAIQERELAREKFKKKTTFTSVLTDSSTKAYREASSKVSEALTSLVNKIDKTKDMDPLYKKNFKKSLLLQQQEQQNIDIAIAQGKVEKLDKLISGTEAVQQSSIGLAAIVGATILTAGTGTAATVASVGARVGPMLGPVVKAAMATGIGAAGGAAAGAGIMLVKGNIENLIKAGFDDDFMCSYIKEQSRSSKKIWQDALVMAQKGAKIGAVGGGFVGAGGIVATLAKSTMTAAGVVGGGYSTYKTVSELRGWYKYSKEAEIAAQNGDNEKAKELIAKAREAAVAAGNHSVDTALAGLLSYHAGKSLLNGIKKVNAKAPTVADEAAANVNTQSGASTQTGAKPSGAKKIETTVLPPSPKIENVVSAENLVKMNPTQRAEIQGILDKLPRVLNKEEIAVFNKAIAESLANNPGQLVDRSSQALVPSSGARPQSPPSGSNSNISPSSSGGKSSTASSSAAPGPSSSNPAHSSPSSAQSNGSASTNNSSSGAVSAQNTQNPPPKNKMGKVLPVAGALSAGLAGAHAVSKMTKKEELASEAPISVPVPSESVKKEDPDEIKPEKLPVGDGSGTSDEDTDEPPVSKEDQQEEPTAPQQPGIPSPGSVSPGAPPKDPDSAESDGHDPIAHEELEEFPPIANTNPANGPLPASAPKEEGFIAKFFSGIGSAVSSLFSFLFGWMKK